MSADQSVEIPVPADLPIVDRRRQVVNAVAMATDRILTQQSNDPKGLVITVHLDQSHKYPSLIVTATVPEKDPAKAPAHRK